MPIDKKLREKMEKPALEADAVDELSMMGRVVKVEKQVRPGAGVACAAPSVASKSMAQPCAHA